MGDTVSDTGRHDPTSPQDAGSDGRSEESSAVLPKTARASRDDATIVTGRPPLGSPALSDSVYRILEGRVLLGDRLSHFELLDYVGGGGMGRVFRALDTQLDRTVALKVLPPDQATDADALQRFQNEAQSSARLDHDNIARTFYVGEDRGLHFIVFEFVDGVNIRVLVERNGPLPLPEAVSYTLQIAEALAHADARNIVHRDIKPSNILITPEGRAKLIDLGLARLRSVDPNAADLTASGVTLGTFDYISPEQARDPRNADIRSDIYSLGCTLFFMLAGRPPFPEGTVLQKLLQHQGDTPPDIQEFRPELSEDVSRVLRKMMAKDPRHRHATPDDLVADLLMLAERIGLQPVTPTGRIWIAPTQPTEPLLQRHLPWLAPMAALLCIVVLLDLFWSSSAHRDEPIQGSNGPKPAAIAPPTMGTKREPVKPPSREPAVPAKAPRQESKSVAPTAPPAVALPKRSNVLVVSKKPVGDNEFLTLGAACAAARSGDVVELRYDGPQEERPIRIADLRLTIRAGEGFRPVVVFRPSDADGAKSSRGMCTFVDSRLTLADVSLELHVPNEAPPGSWSLVEARGGPMIRLDRCVLTARGAADPLAADHQDITVFCVRSASDGEAAAESTMTTAPPGTIEMTDCIVRGEAVMLRVDPSAPAVLTCENSLLALSEPILVDDGRATESDATASLRIELRHVTAAARGGLCRLNRAPKAVAPRTVRIASTDSILLGSAGVPLIEQQGDASVEEMRRGFAWHGEGNVYQDVDVFWSLRDFDRASSPDVMDFQAWKAFWGPARESRPTAERLVWRISSAGEQPLHDASPAEYTLEDPTYGDAWGGAPGCLADRLPSIPRTPASERTPRGASAGGSASVAPLAP